MDRSDGKDNYWMFRTNKEYLILLIFSVPVITLSKSKSTLFMSDAKLQPFNPRRLQVLKIRRVLPSDLFVAGFS